MESSDDSFVWMSATSDSSDSDSKNTNMSAAVQTKGEDGDYSDSKKKLRKRLFEEEQGMIEEEPPQKRKKKLKREHGATPARTPCVKPEPESDADAELAYRVKKEQGACGTSSHNHNHASTDTQSSKNNRTTCESDTLANNDTKSETKSKKRKRNSSLNTNTDIKDMIVKDMFSAEETVVENRQRKASENASQKSNRRSIISKEGNGDITNNEFEKTYTSKEFVSSDSSSSDENRNTKKKKKKKRNSKSLTPKIKLKGNDSTSSHTQETTFEPEESIHQNTKLSDRIQYEDENDSEAEKQITRNDQPYNTEILSTRLKRFIKSKPHLKAITPNGESDSLISQADEVWVLKCPQEMDISSLRNKDLQLDTKCKLKIDGQAYDGSLIEERGRIAILSCANNQATIHNVSLNSTVNFRKRIPKPHFVEDNVVVNNQTNFIPLPDTKCRHPLFGPDYKKAMKIPSAIKARLKAENLPQQEQPEKKKKKKKHKEEESGAEPETETAYVSRKKRKHELVAEETEEVMPPPKKSKKIKHEVSADTWESEKAIEENLFNF